MAAPFPADTPDDLPEQASRSSMRLKIKLMLVPDFESPIQSARIGLMVNRD